MPQAPPVIRVRDVVGFGWPDLHCRHSELADPREAPFPEEQQNVCVPIPAVQAQGNPGHLLVTGVKNVAVADDDVATGVFAYDNGVTGGTLLVNCIHRDTKGTLWSSY